MSISINGSTGISGINGSAAVPAIAGGDSDTGIFFGTNTASIATGGSQRLTIDSNGTITFSVTGDSDAAVFDRTDATGTARITIRSGDGSYGTINATDGGNSLAFFTGTTQRMDIASDGDVTVEESLKVHDVQLPTDGPLAYRNKIINGDFCINQRQVAPYQMTGTADDDTYFIDRWKCGVGVHQFSTTTPVVDYTHEGGPTELGFRYCARATVSTAGVGPDTTVDGMLFKHVVETTRLLDLRYGTSSALPMTLSFWFKSSVTGSYSIFMYRPTGNRNLLLEFTVDTANTWEYKELAIPGDTAHSFNTNASAEGMRIEWRVNVTGSNLGSAVTSWANLGSSRAVTGNVAFFESAGAIAEITGVQLEKGTKATPFEYRGINSELPLCQRYYYTTRNLDQSTHTFTGSLTPSPNTSTSSRHSGAQFPVSMRANPTITLYNPVTNTAGQVYRGLQSPTSPSANAADVGMNGFRLGNISGGIQLGADAAFGFNADADMS